MINNGDNNNKDDDHGNDDQNNWIKEWTAIKMKWEFKVSLKTISIWTVSM